MRVPPNEGGASPFVLPCEHASNHVPAAYAGLGLPPRDLGRHIARDIGAAALARGMSRRLDAPPFLSGYSRLLIDCNRPPGAPTSIRARSGGTDIPGNLGLDAGERARHAPARKRHLDFVNALVPPPGLLKRVEQCIL
jgi:predicted N-formylglutamate amidohydrolase